MHLVLVLVFTLVFSFKDTSFWLRNLVRNYFNFPSDNGSQDVGSFGLKIIIIIIIIIIINITIIIIIIFNNNFIEFPFYKCDWHIMTSYNKR